MPFCNGSGLIVCINSGTIIHEYFGSKAKVTSWQPMLLMDSCGLDVLMSEITGFSVVRNPVIGNEFISFTGCVLEPNKPASYYLYKVTKGGISRVSNNVVFSGFWTPKECVKALDHNSFYYGKRKVLKDHEQIMRIVPCQDQFLSRFDPLMLTVLDVGSGSFRSILYKRTDDSFWRVKDDGGNEVCNPTIYDGKMVHVKDEKFLETPYYLE